MLDNPPLPMIVDPSRLAALDATGLLDSAPEQGFDDIVRLATRLCDAPVALVSFVAADRQWFKARVGFPPCETDLDRSVCKFVLAEPDLLIIPDLTADPRTAANPLVTGEPHIRFYAGAPLRVRGGQTLGSLCVIDTAPRPYGLAPEQADDLRALARQVTDLIELRRAASAERVTQALAVADAARLEAMIATQQVVASAVADLDTIFAAIVAGALRVIDAAKGAVVELREGDVLVYRTTAGASAVHQGIRLPLHDTLSGRALLAEVPLYCPDTQTDPQADHAMARDLGIRALIVVPVFRQGVAIGVLKVQSDAPDAFSARDILMAQMLAGLVASGVSEVAEAQTRQALREAESRYKAIFDSATDFAIVAADTQGRITDWNVGATQIMGWAEDEIRDQPLAAFFTPEDRANAVPAREMDLALSNGTAQDERWHLSRSGERFWAMGRMMALRHEDGAPRGFLKILQDRTLQRKAEMDLRASEAQLEASEAHWRGLFERLSEGFIVGEVIRDGNGAITDWRYVDVNAAWGDLVGVDPGTVVGRTIREVFPGIEDAWVDEFADVVRTRQPVTFVRQVGTLRRWYEGRAFPLGTTQFGVLFSEVTARVETEVRRDALLELGDRLRDLDEVSALVRAAAEILARSTGATRAGYGVVDAARETVEVPTDWCAPGQASVAGLHDFRDYGSYIEDLKRGEIVVMDDVACDPRTRDTADALIDLGIRSFINVPVMERGQIVGIALVHYAETHAFTKDDLAFVRVVADRVQIAVARVRAEADQHLLNEEISHRLKNSFAIVLSIAGQTLRTIPDRAPVEAFERRIHALSTAHDVLLRKTWTAAPAKDVVQAVLANAGHADRIAVSGPQIDLGPRATLSLSLLLHELATNAAKYGALSVPEGRVAVDWRLEGEGEEQEVVLDWTEQDGPPVAPPIRTGRRGFGARLIGLGLAGTGGVDLRFLPSGFEATMRAPLVQLQRS